MLKAVFCAWTLLVIGGTMSSAQLISIRTVPVSQAHQFEIFPSHTVSMGGVSIAVMDSLLDPFTNPAKGAHLQATRFFGSPSAYSVSSNAGGGRTLPIGALSRHDVWFGGVWFALQQIDLIPRPDLTGIQPLCLGCERAGIDLGPAERSKGNTYAFALAGRELGNGLSVGGSASWAELNAVDGVDLLYAGSARIKQFGHSLDVRLGALKEWSDSRSLEALVLHNRFGASHDVWYLDSFWDPGSQQFNQRPRLEQNLDHTRTWGLHLAYEQPLSAHGWRAGVVATANRMDHPKIPNYEIMNIPRDPGNSSAFNLGVGLGRTLGRSTFGLDLVYEPIWSHTWADAAAPVETSTGRMIPQGGRTIENRFRFSNTHARLGLAQDLPIDAGAAVVGLQLGLAVRGTHYWLDQRDHIQLTDRNHEERWTEWTPTWGVSLRFTELEIRYHGSVTHGTGRPGVAPRGILAVAEATSLSNILVAPSGPLTLDEVKVTTHRVSISLPVR